MSRICKRGHASSALPGGRTAKRHCKECQRAYYAKWCAENRERLKVYNAKPERKVAKQVCDAKYRAKHLEQVKVGQAKYRAENIERIREYDAKRYRPPEHKVRRNAYSAKWQRENPGKHCSNQAARRARKLQQTCTCCNPKDVAALYTRAHARGFEVDHKQALRLGGLHCLKNLEVLTPAAHKFKTANWDIPLVAAVRKLKRHRDP
jgi:hypothetical protein